MNQRSHNKPAIEGGNPTRKEPLAFCRASLDERDVDAVVETLRSGWLTAGPKTEQFERELAGYLGARHVIAVSSCSEAMFLALKALGIGPGDEVITSCMTFASTVHAITHTGATPVLADVENETYGLDPEDVERKITARTRAILPVHFAGQACRIHDICALAAGKGLFVVEDAAHSVGAKVDARPLGSFGDATAFSFYATKNLTTGEGGALSTNDDELADKLRLLSYHGMSRDSWARYSDKGSWYYEVELDGFKCNASDLSSSLGLSQLAKLDALLERRTEIARSFSRLLADNDHVTVVAERRGNVHTWHLFVVLLNLETLSVDRDHFSRALTAENIGNSVHFIPIYRHPFFAGRGVGAKDFPNCERYFSRCISLPIYPDMSQTDVDDVVAAVNKVAAFYHAR